MAKFITVILILTILNGFLAIFIAIRLRSKNPTHTGIDRYLIRGFLSIIVGSISLLLFRWEVLNVWTALLPMGVLITLSEILLAAREKRQLIRKGLYDPAEFENRRQQERANVKAKGKSRYVWEHIIIYGVGGFLLMVAFSLAGPGVLPFYTWAVAPLFAAFCGAVAALEKWKRQNY